MLSSKDYEKYLNQIERIEASMLKKYEECRMKVEDSDIKNIFKSLVQSESGHESIVKSLTELFRNSVEKKN